MFLVFLVGRIVQPAFKLPGEFGNICKRAQAGNSERPWVQAALSRDVLQHWSGPTCLWEGILVKHARHRRLLLRARRSNSWGVYGFCSQDRRAYGTGRTETKVGQSQVCCHLLWRKKNPATRGRGSHHQEITEDDLLRATKKLRVLGTGFTVIPLDSGRYLVQVIFDTTSLTEVLHNVALQFALNFLSVRSWRGEPGSSSSASGSRAGFV